MAEGTLGMVLRTQPLRESDLLVALYTEAHGRISAVARGARRSQRRFSGALSLLVLGRFELGRKPRGELWNLEAAHVVREWTQLSSDVIAVAHASYVAELIQCLLPHELPEPRALDLVIAHWDSLASAGPSPGVLRAIELGILELVGHRPRISVCAACGETVGDGAVFDPSRGGATCRRCAAISRSAGVRPYDSGTRSYLQAIESALDGNDLVAARSTDDVEAHERIAGREALVTMITQLAGRPLRTLEYLAKLGAAGVRAEGS